MTITIPMFVFTIIIPVYLGLGVLVYFPAELHAYRQRHNPSEGYWEGLWNGWKRHPLVPFLFVIAWPYWLYQELVR